MPRPKPDPEVALIRNREQARNRVSNARGENLERGGENLSGSIDAETTQDLNYIVQQQKKTNNQASKIGAVRWAIRKAAEILRAEKTKREEDKK